MLGNKGSWEDDMNFSPIDSTTVLGNEHGAQQQAQLPSPQQQKPKALRFVTNYGAPHPKRRRIGAACLTCRKRKTACSGERPTCETCKQNKLECAGYSSETSTPGHRRTTSDASSKQPGDFNNDSYNTRPRKIPSQKRQHDAKLNPHSRNNHSAGFEGCPPPPRPHHVQAQGPTPPNQRVNGPMANTGVLPVSSSYDHLANISAVEPQTQLEAENERREEWQDSLFSGPRNRMPYFRWLGPTAIMPGFKQMVVKVTRQDQDIARSSTDGGGAGVNMVSPPTLNGAMSGTLNAPDQRDAVESDARTPLNLPFYDTSPTPPSELITHLAETFFTHLGCNYPFLQKERFMKDLDDKQVDAILVDAVCALAARFSTHHLLTTQTSDENKTSPAEYGHAFAQRAKTALVDTFPCPSVAVVQAALLLAYNEFGESRDSGLWMYLGISIRMAQDLGMHKLEGLKYRGKSGPTPKMIKRESMSGSPELVGISKAAKKETSNETAREKVMRETAETMVEAADHADGQKGIDEQKAVEQERVDTFWAVFFLDRMVSSGTGRRCTLRDKEIELSFPALDETDPKSGWPSVFPALIRIVHLYGRVADLLNSIKEPSDITTETPKKLASMESQVTNFYQGLSPRLHFDAGNFQHYMKAGEGTNFVLLHFWFHTLIVILHRPTLLLTFEGRMLQLFPNSQQLSMSSAKTIADILSYSQLMDAKASLGNPFTTQPIYIAACAFLKETAEQTATSTVQSREHSRESSPSRKQKSENGNVRSVESRPMSTQGTPKTTRDQKRMSISELSGLSPTDQKRTSISELSNTSQKANPARSPSDESKQRRNSSMTVEQHKSSDKSGGSAMSAAKTATSLARHTLLATAASQHYQLCYKALQSLETYWAGTKYILTVLDQKFEGVGDPLLYTVEEGESAMERPRPEPAFTSPGWRRKLSWGPYLYNPNMVAMQSDWLDKAGQMPGSPSDLSKAIGWTLTGTMNSPNTSLAWHYPNSSGLQPQPSQSQALGGTSHTSMASPADYDPSMQNMHYPKHLRTASSTSHAHPSLTSYPTNASAMSNQDTTDLLMGMSSPYQTNSHGSHTDAVGNHDVFAHLHSTTSNDMNTAPDTSFVSSSGPTGNHVASSDAAAFNAWSYHNLWNPNSTSTMQPFGDMMIESQDVDMSMLGLDMMPWFDNYPPQDYAGVFDTSPQGGGADSHGGASSVTGAP